jgi:hypothetical protein
MISQEEESIIEEMGWSLVCHSPMEMEHSDGSTAKGVSTCKLVIKDAIKEYHEMKAEQAEEAEKAEKASATASLNLETINGREILEFLTDAVRNDDDLCDISPGGPFEFESQLIEEDEYKLYFTAYFNNWGTDQAQESQVIKIGPKGVVVWLGEAFEGDGSDEAMEESITKWLKTHEFRTDSKEQFGYLIESARERLGKVQFNEPDDMDTVMSIIAEAKSYMK